MFLRELFIISSVYNFKTTTFLILFLFNITYLKQDRQKGLNYELCFEIQTVLHPDTI